MILTFRNEYKLRVLENGVLVRKFGPKTAELHNEEIHNRILHIIWTTK